MVIKRKEPKITAVQVDIEDIINRGGSPTGEVVSNGEALSDSEIRFTLRIPLRLIKKLDAARAGRVGKLSRNQLILELINKGVK